MSPYGDDPFADPASVWWHDAPVVALPPTTMPTTTLSYRAIARDNGELVDQLVAGVNDMLARCTGLTPVPGAFRVHCVTHPAGAKLVMRLDVR